MKKSARPSVNRKASKPVASTRAPLKPTPVTGRRPSRYRDPLLHEDDFEIASRVNRTGSPVLRISGFQPPRKPGVQKDLERGLPLLPDEAKIQMSQRFIVTQQGFFDVMQQLAPLFNPSSRDRKRYYFRGEACTSFGLIPSLLRDGVYERLSEQHGASSPIDLQKKLLDRFRRYTQHIIHSDNDFIAPIWNDFDTLCLAQHHGLPTLLLDWTLNPYVAAYFALSEAYKTLLREKLSANPEIVRYYVRVWVMRLKSPDVRRDSTVHLEDRKQNWDERLGDLGRGLAPTKPLIVVPLVFTRRIAAQVGRFVYCGYMSHEYQETDPTRGRVKSLAKHSFDVCNHNREYKEDFTKVPEELGWNQLYSLDIEFDISHYSSWKEAADQKDLPATKELKLEAFRQEIMMMMSDLEFIGFHAGRLFPDLEGWARYLAEGNL